MLGLANVKQRLIVHGIMGKLIQQVFHLDISHLLKLTLICIFLWVLQGPLDVGDNIPIQGECIFFGSS